MLNTAPTTTPKFIAWHRGRWEPWRPLAHGDTEAQALRASLGLQLAGDWLVQAAGRDPNDREMPRRNRRRNNRTGSEDRGLNRE